VKRETKEMVKNLLVDIDAAMNRLPPEDVAAKKAS
jgi:hypothetical protein